AASTSASMFGFSSTADLLAKDKSGNIIPWTPSVVNYTSPIAPSFFSYGAGPETPLTRLSELFNVNHFIVSQANPYIVPFMSRGLKDRKSGGSDRSGFSVGIMERIARVILAEIKHRLGQLNQIGILPHFVVQLVEEKVSGNVTIVPEVQLEDFKTIISNPTHESIQYWILKGEQSTWPFLSMLKYRLMIELALDRILLQLRAEASASAIQAGIESAHRHVTGRGHHRRQKSGPKKLSPNSHSPSSMTRRGSSANVPGGGGGGSYRLSRMTSGGGHETDDSSRTHKSSSSISSTFINSGKRGYFLGVVPHTQEASPTEGHQAADLDCDEDIGYPIPPYDPKRSKSMH
ncbi:hypothetical protein BG004_000956, partial [Podila humilis]